MIGLIGSSLAVDCVAFSAGPADDRDGGDAASGDSSRDASTVLKPDCIEGAERFCANFDGLAPAAGWTRTNTYRGQITYDAVGLSAPHAMRAQIFMDAGTGAADLIKDYPDTAATFRCELDMDIEFIPDYRNAQVNLLTIETKVNSQPHSVYLASFAGTWKLGEYQAMVVNQLVDIGPLMTGRWFHLVLEVTKTTATVTTPWKTATLGALQIPSGPGRALHVGVQFASGEASTGAVLFDNIDCTTTSN